MTLFRYFSFFSHFGDDTGLLIAAAPDLQCTVNSYPSSSTLPYLAQNIQTQLSTAATEVPQLPRSKADDIFFTVPGRKEGRCFHRLHGVYITSDSRILNVGPPSPNLGTRSKAHTAALRLAAPPLTALQEPPLTRSKPASILVTSGTKRQLLILYSSYIILE